VVLLFATGLHYWGFLRFHLDAHTNVVQNLETLSYIQSAKTMRNIPGTKVRFSNLMVASERESNGKCCTLPVRDVRDLGKAGMLKETEAILD
jgi:hypothetical protein